MLFTEHQLKRVLYGRNTLYEVATEYFDENIESILEVHNHFTGYVEVVEELDKQVKEYEHFKNVKYDYLDDFETIKNSVMLSEGFKDLKSLYNSVQYFKGREVYFSLLNSFNDDLIDFVEKVISLYGNTLNNYMMYRGDFNSYYYTYFIEGEEIEDEDVLCFMIDQVREWLKD